jgi:sulfoxide reductase catalytic subunit YedY
MPGAGKGTAATRRAGAIPSREITPQELVLGRRELLRGAAALAGAALWPACSRPPLPREALAPLEGVRPSPLSTPEEPTAFEAATTYNNFYEFGSGKGDAARLAGRMRTRPWSLVVEGEVERAGVFDLEDLLRPHPLEERVTRLRCVEAWSMVIPWVGFPLADLLRRLAPTSRAKYVAFETFYDPEQMPRRLFPAIDFPYVEALRIDEAMHPLAFLAVGMYGVTLPNQNGAPLRLVVPWKYGFKSIKSIARIRFAETQPATSWNLAAPGEYGFYANVNPAVPHPRWSQASERRVGELFERATLPFNGYAEEVAHLYTGMDLRSSF